jgi:hypothetical protein
VLDEGYAAHAEEKLEIYLAATCIPNHAWNADFLDSRLAALTSEDLKASWCGRFDSMRSQLTDSAERIAIWAHAVPERGGDAEVLRLAKIALRWLAVVDNATITSHAQAALVRLDTDDRQMGRLLP